MLRAKAALSNAVLAQRSLSSKAPKLQTGKEKFRIARRIRGGKKAEPPLFTQRVIMSDGSTLTRLSTAPTPLLRLARDSRTHLAWNPEAFKEAKILEEADSRMAKFRTKFSDFDV